MAVLAAAVTAALAADGLDADLTVLGDVLADLGQVAAIDVAVHRHALAALAAEQLVQGHVGHFALMSHRAMSTPEIALFSMGPLRQ